MDAIGETISGYYLDKFGHIDRASLSVVALLVIIHPVVRVSVLRLCVAIEETYFRGYATIDRC